MSQYRLSPSAPPGGAPRRPARASRLRSLPLAIALLFLVLAPAFLTTPPALAGPFTDPGWDPLEMVAWATTVDAFAAGLQDIAQPGLGVATFGLPAHALGPVTGDNFDIVSLGDAGTITLHFAGGIGDGIGDDFAVFENSFFTVGGLFAELAFVEVSSNGVDFVRFPSETVNTFMVAGFDPIDPTDYNNLAGDQVFERGTGFDLRDVAGDPLVLSGTVDLTDIRYVRLIDVIGDGSTTDAFGAPIYDPYPTPFTSGGFDLDAVGVLVEAPEPGLGIGLSIGVVALSGIRRGRRVCAGSR